MRIALGFAAGLVVACSAFAAAGVPSLVIDSGGHTAIVRSMLFTRDGTRLVSAGDDKVIRVWDTRTGKLERAIRGQIGDGDEGKIYALALSPDERVLAVGGYLAGDKPDTRAIRLHDFATGEVIGLLKGHRDVVESLAFSSEGILASASADRTVMLWRLGQDKPWKILKGHTGRVHTVAFSPDGKRLATGSFDHSVRVWDAASGKQLAEMRDHGQPILSVVFAPDGNFVVSSAGDQKVRYWDGKKGSQSTVLLEAESDGNLSFSADGRLLLASRSGNAFTCELLHFPETTRPIRFRRHDDAIQATAITADGRLAASAGGHRQEIFIWSTDGNRVTTLVGRGRAVPAVAFAKDGLSIAFGDDFYAQPQPNSYGPLNRRVTLYRGGAADISFRDDVNEPAYSRAVASRQGDRLEVEHHDLTDTLYLIRNGNKVSVKRDNTTGYYHVCYSFTPDGKYVISGGLGGVLTLYRAGDLTKVLDFVGHTGEVFSVAVSPDSRTLVSGSDDQTVRIWDIPTGRNLLSLFADENAEWVAWTQEGYYVSSGRGDQYVGWHWNQGVDRVARYLSVAQFQNEFYQPSAIAERLRTRQGAAKLSAADIPNLLPPDVRISNVTVAGKTVRFSVRATSTNLPITSLRVFVNGAALRLPEGAIKGDPQKRNLQAEAAVRPGPNSVYARAETSNGVWSGQEQTVQASGVAASAPTNDLYVLAIGIRNYPNLQRLAYADQDAHDIAAALQKQEGKLYRRVYPTVVLNGQATRAGISAALVDFSKLGQAGDTHVLYLSGHGDLDDQDYYFDTYDHRSGSTANDLSWHDLLHGLQKVQGPIILFVDTCHAAGAAGAGNYNYVLRGVGAGGDSAMYTYAAATTEQDAIEPSELKHGLFTYALLNSLREPVPQEASGLVYSDLLAVRVRQAMMKVQKQWAARAQEPAHFVLPLGNPAEPLFAVAP